MGLLYGLLTSLSIGTADLFGRRVVDARGPIVTGTVIQFVAIIVSLLAVLVVDSAWNATDLGLGVLSGLGMACGLWGYFAGLQRASSAVIAPLVAAMSAVIPYGYAVVRGDDPTPVALAGALLAIAGVAVVTMGGGPIVHLAAGLRWGVFSGLGFGFGLSVVIDAGDASGAWPAVGQRIGALAVMVTVMAVTEVTLDLGARLRVSAASAGVAAGASTVFYLLGVSADATSAVVAASVFPAVTVLVGRFVYHDAVRPRQIAGVGGAILGVVLLALG